MLCSFGILTLASNPREALFNKAKDNLFRNPEETIKISNQLLKDETDVNKKAELYLTLSKAYIAKRDFDKSLTYVTKVQDLLGEITNSDTKAQILISIAIQYQQMEVFNKSLSFLDEIDQHSQKMPDSSRIKFSVLGKAYAVRGMIYKSQLNPELALSKFTIAVKNFEKIAPALQSNANLSVVFYNIGYCYLDLNDKNKAEESFLNSINFAQKEKARSLEAFAYKGLSDVYMKNAKHLEALQLLSKADSLAANIGDLLLNEGIYKVIAENYLALNDINNYNIYNQKYLQTRFLREQNELQSINTSIDNIQKENKKNLDEISQSQTKLDSFIIIFGAILVILFLFLIWKKRQANRLLQEKIKVILNS
ncbi:Tetratricopeptide repeat-containing protein [Soonwooa buanensis]|uniref:Tetratricopeptide repeat-containing protein n=2 Tax=Soonwooa buanensis TaxID=619805 RepID=A0A1T5DJY3_9FLAO|nr:Tetratricopeptide repeat-containing protein [Soonwooa buanensis]